MASRRWVTSWTAWGAYGTGPSLYVHDPDGYTLELKPRPGR